MRNFIIALFMFLFLLSYVSATSSYNLDLAQRDSDNWMIRNTDTFGKILLRHDNKVRATAENLRPYTWYTLVFTEDSYKDGINVDISCLNSRQTTRNGNMKVVSVKFRYIDLLNDDKKQRFWIVLKKDVDCKNQKFLQWNPKEYLFDLNGF